MNAERATEIDQKIAGLDPATEPCWFPTTPDGMAFEWGDGCPHWQSEEEGRATIAMILSHYPVEPPALVLTRGDAPCWHLTCDECGYRYDENEHVSHFGDQAEARSNAEDCDWRVVDGRLLCPDAPSAWSRSMPEAEMDVPDDPPGIDPHTDALPSADDARDRVIAFLRWYGDGRVIVDTGEVGPPLYARDLEALTRVTPLVGGEPS